MRVALCSDVQGQSAAEEHRIWGRLICAPTPFQSFLFVTLGYVLFLSEQGEKDSNVYILPSFHLSFVL